MELERISNSEYILTTLTPINANIWNIELRILGLVARYVVTQFRKMFGSIIFSHLELDDTSTYNYLAH